MRLLCGKAHHTAFSTQLSLEAQVQGLSGLFVRTHTRAAKNRPDLRLSQTERICLRHDRFDAPAPAQGHRSKRIPCFDVIVAVESLAHTVGQVLRKGIHRILRGALTPLRDFTNLQCSFLVCEDVHCWRNRCKTHPGNESVHLQEKIMGERVPQHLISLFRTARPVSLNELGHTRLKAQVTVSQFLSYGPDCNGRTLKTPQCMNQESLQFGFQKSAAPSSINIAQGQRCFWGEHPRPVQTGRRRERRWLAGKARKRARSADALAPSQGP